MIELTFLLLIAGFAFLLGRRLMSLCSFEFITWAGDLAAATSLGLGILGYIVLGVGLLGCLNLPAIMSAAGAVLVLAYLPWPVVHSPRGNFEPVRRPGAGIFDLGNGWPSIPRVRQPKVDGPLDATSLFQLALVVVACTGTLISALAPPTAGDALCYHLEIPKRFVQLGAVQYLPFTDNSLFPFLMEMLYGLGLLLGGPVLAQLLHWLVGVLFALAVVELSAPIVGKSSRGWAATIALLVPGVTNQMTSPLNDLAVTLYCTLMIVAWTRWNATLQRRWLVLAGVFGGFGLSVKLVTGAMVVVLLAAMFIHECRRRGIRAATLAGATFVLCLSLAGGVWYARSWYYLGNPVYPYFNSFFGLEAHTHSLLIATHNLIGVPWLATMHPEDFGGRGVQFGAAFLALLPGFALLRRSTPELGRLLLLAGGFATIWFLIRQDLRFLLPIIPILAVAVVVVVQEVRELHRPAFVVASGCLAILLLFQSLIVLKRARPCVSVALGWESREAYLERHEPSYKVAEFVNTQLAGDCRLISQDYRGLYFEPEFVREDALRRRMPYEERSEALVDHLASYGFTHILLVESHNAESAIYDQSFTERLGAAVDRLPLLLATHFEGPGGDRRDYRLLELPRSKNLEHLEQMTSQPRYRLLRTGN